jgi:protein SCO1/2
MSQTRWKKYAGLLGILLLFPLTFLVVFNSMEHRFDSLPYFGTHLALSGSEGEKDTLYYRLPPFRLTNQNGELFPGDSLKGRVYLAAFFSTNSPFISKISKRLLTANFRYRAEADISIVCFSTDPTYDTPEILSAYTHELKVSPPKFVFLTATDSTDLYGFIRDAFLIEDPLNTATIWLVDGDGHLRGKYDGNKEEEIQRAMEDIALLKKEKDLALYRREKAGNK